MSNVLLLNLTCDTCGREFVLRKPKRRYELPEGHLKVPVARAWCSAESGVTEAELLPTEADIDSSIAELEDMQGDPALAASGLVPDPDVEAEIDDYRKLRAVVLGRDDTAPRCLQCGSHDVLVAFNVSGAERIPHPSCGGSIALTNMDYEPSSEGAPDVVYYDAAGSRVRSVPPESS